MSHKQHHKKHNMNKKNEKSYCHSYNYEKFKKYNLVSNIPNWGKHQDLQLVDPWNIVMVGKNDMWVSNKATGVLTNYDSCGNIISTSVVVPDVGIIKARPTGLILNESSGFVISQGPNIASSFLIVATENGTICGYNPLVDPSNAIIAVDNSGSNACYKGLAMVNNYLCATDFHNNKIDVFDFNFVQVLTFPFVDLGVLNPIPSDYAPFNIVNIDDYMYVTYAKQLNPLNVDDQPGKGNGYVTIFNNQGLYVKRLLSRGKLNSPYGIIKTPHTFGELKNKIMVGNNGNGKIHVYNCDGDFVGTIRDKYKYKLTINGLHGFADFWECDEYVYFAAGSTDDMYGIVGNLKKEC